MSGARYDVIVIGGGIHGVGVAQAAAAAGYRTLVLEKTDLASGTSSRSSKLIHGGLRYLETAQFRLVRESLREREILLRIAPELVRLVPFHLPVYHDTTRRPWQIRAGLALYALLGRLRDSTRFSVVPRHKWADLDGLKTDGLHTVFQYWDGQTDDTALVRAVMRSAVSLGAELKCPATFVGARRNRNGFEVDYRDGAGRITCGSRTLVNAAGPWAGLVMQKITPRVTGPPVELVQGAHIVMDSPINRGIYYLEAPRDRRAVFVMPWGDMTLVGTTETAFNGDPDHVAALPKEINYLQSTLRHYFPAFSGHIIDSFAGLRVLPTDGHTHFRRPRETILHYERNRMPGMVTIFGGKLTGYRATAQKVLRLLQHSLPAYPRIADTAMLRLEPGI